MKTGIVTVAIAVWMTLLVAILFDSLVLGKTISIDMSSASDMTTKR